MMAKDAPPLAAVPTAPAVPTIPTGEDMKAIRAVKDGDLPWLPPEIGPGEKLLTKMKENPFVPIGAFVCIAYPPRMSNRSLVKGRHLVASGKRTP